SGAGPAAQGDVPTSGAQGGHNQAQGTGPRPARAPAGPGGPGGPGARAAGEPNVRAVAPDVRPAGMVAGIADAIETPDAEDLASPGQTELSGMDLIQRELGGQIIGEIED
ncbi:MAG TPA: hypothetical protein VKV33_03405, partial [Streptosporangiaceae bacterium]|nr:hypothetical protein [Streptosporangiaceae bacterium]